jgi:6-phosphogluconolactonase
MVAYGMVGITAFLRLSSLAAEGGAAKGSAHSGGILRLYIGTYTGARSKGIYMSSFDSATGALTAPELAVEAHNPTFLALGPDQRFLYAVAEIDNFGGKPAGAVAAYGIEAKSGKLTLLNQQPSGGTGPCHVCVDKTGKCLLVANYGSGSVAALPIQADGRLGEAGSVIQHHGSSINPQRQAGPHAHYIAPDAADRFAFACDLGLDKVLVYKLEAGKALLVPNEPASISISPGSGPRHLAFHPNGRFVYLVSEMGSSVTAMNYNPLRGELGHVQTVSALPEGFNEHNSGAEIQMHPSGKFVYASNRGHNSIGVFRVEPESGKLTLVHHESTQGKTPRFFGIEPNGDWLLAANQDSHNIVVFRIQPESGRLTPEGKPLEIGSPVCIVFVPREK